MPRLPSAAGRNAFRLAVLVSVWCLGMPALAVHAAEKAPAAKLNAAPPAVVKSDAQANTTDPAAPTAIPPLARGADPVVASVEGHPIYLSDLGRATRALPSNLRSLPFDTLYPVLLDRMVDHELLVMLARRRGLEDNPAVRKEIEAATERVLEGALLSQEAAPKVTERAIKARYDRLYANRSATEEVRARHILVTSEAEANSIIAKLRKGADFATLANELSKDPDASKGGDLGYFRREQVWPGFADVAFALQPSQVADKPIHNEFGWHVIEVDEKRLVAAPSYSDLHDQLRDEMMQDAVKAMVAEARGQMTVHKWNLDGSEMDAAAKPGTSLVRSAK